MCVSEARAQMEVPEVTPFTAAQIRDATKAGRTYVYRIELTGSPIVLRTMCFGKVDADGAELTISMKRETGEPVGDPETKRVTWEDLRKHAEFPKTSVTISESELEVLSGTRTCTVYTVCEGKSVTCFFFAKDLPGAPVLFHTEEDGARVVTSLLVSHDGGT